MDKRTINFTIRLSQKEYEIIKERAQYYGLPISTYIRFKTIQDEFRRKEENNNDKLQCME